MEAIKVMKIKNKIILLITISLFLVSIGSVCAIDDNMTDLSMQAEDDYALSVDNPDISTSESNADDTGLQATDSDVKLSGNAAKTKIISKNVQKGNNETLTIPAEVKTTAGSSVTVNSSEINVYNNNKKLTTTYENSIITIKDKLNPGVYNLTIKFEGNDAFKKSDKNITLSVYEIKTVQSININSTKKGLFNLNITDGKNIYNIKKSKLDLKVTYKDGNTTKSLKVSKITVKNGTVSFSLSNLNFTNATITLNYEGTSPKNITLNRIYNVNVEVLNAKNEYKTGNFTFRAVDIDNNNAPVANAEISLTTVGNIRAGFSAKTDEKGIATFKTDSLYIFDQTSSITMEPLQVGKQLVTIATKNNVKSTSKDLNLTITKANVKITTTRYVEYYGSEKNITVTVTKSDGNPLANEYVHFYMSETTNKDYYFGTDSNGQCKINLKNLIPGTYSYSVSMNDTANINLKATNGTAGIAKLPVTILLSTKAMYYNTGNTASLKVINQKTGQAIANATVKVLIYTGNTFDTYRYKTDNRGFVTFQAPASVGTHKIVVNIAEQEYEPRYKPYKVTKNLGVVKATGSILAPKATYYYKEGRYVVMKLTNSRNNQPIFNAQLNIKIYISSTQYYNYLGRTDGSGIIRIPTTLYTPGTYKVEISGAEPANFICNSVTTQLVIQKAPAKIEPAKVTVKQGANKYMSIKVLNTKTDKVIPEAEVSVKVYTGNSYSTYKLTTDKNGYAYLGTKSLNVGTHKVVISPANSYISANTETTYITVTK